MYALALTHAAGSVLSDAASTAGSALPYVHMGSFEIGPLPIQAFGVIVAIGVLIGAALLRRYAEWHGVHDDNIRGLLAWITVTGFLGAHWFDVIAYQADKPWFEFGKGPAWKPGNWPLFFQLWSGISSYGGFLGGAMGFAFYVWWKRLNARLMADIGIVGLLPAFSIGRIGCTVVSDHIGRAISPDAWYSFIAMKYPTADKLVHSGIGELVHDNPALKNAEFIPAWNLGLVEFLYLVPVNALILWLAFRRKRMPAGLLIVLAGMLYAPVRFFMDFLRPVNSDPRYFDLTFAQWASLLAFGAAAYVAYLIKTTGKVAETIAPTSGEAQEALNVALKEDADEDDDGKKKGTTKKPVAKDLPKATVKKPEKKDDALDPKKEEEKRIAKELEEKRALEKKQKEDADEIAAAERRKKQDEALAAKKAADAAAAKADDKKADDKKADDKKADDKKADKESAATDPAAAEKKADEK